MGAKEDQVRARLAKEERERLVAREREAERIAAEKSKNRERYDSILMAIDHEAERIASELERANWGGKDADMFNFTVASPRWWQRSRIEQLACLQFSHLNIEYGYGFRLYMRSDGVLHIDGWSKDHLLRPAAKWSFYDFHHGFSNASKELYMLLAHLREFTFTKQQARRLP